MSFNQQDLLKILGGLSKKLSDQFGDIGKMMKPFETKRSVKVPINGKLSTVEITHGGVVYVTIPDCTDEDITALLNKLK